MWSVSKRQAAIKLKRSEGRMLSRQCRLSWNLFTRSLLNYATAYPLQSGGILCLAAVCLTRSRFRPLIALGSQITRMLAPQIRQKVAAYRARQPDPR
ncbi:hypothetical protein [Vibrio sp. ABG19]|uniref:hypothetical protein n=1 Tax=Vibrio sp. ABG19 TaxID=2817385 RepID=UPI00249E4EC3|nr:hypothetical protein [Vibrio sp. ABG19]WGY46397.1 hypothetical protein J0X00_16410 [Vibrio sp. ABG19]